MARDTKLNRTKEYKRFLLREKRNTILVHLLRWIVLILFFVLWEVLARNEIIDSFIISYPSKLWQTFVNLIHEGTLGTHIKITLLETIISFLLSTTIGVIVAIILWWSWWVRKVTEPYIIALNALPKIALGPIIILIVGAGYNAIITMSILITVVITTIDMLSGFMNVEKNKILLLQSMNATKFQILTKLVLPSSRPTFISVLKINVGLSWVGTIMGEYLVSKAGLGYLLVYGSQVFQLDLVMCSTVILCVLAGGMYAIVDFIERRLISRHKKIN